eukprot:TRINITY_DN4012_c1_g1_i30.p1 TRINITY_DN4012_c1_g1~~TRINITY_DN4012_c1_g1_i30.p1  ORF type:complete len:966 (+),score=182.01 TRINITY_DN4012_c1_g1_i30:388-3285(+)
MIGQMSSLLTSDVSPPPGTLLTRPPPQPPPTPILQPSLPDSSRDVVQNPDTNTVPEEPPTITLDQPIILFAPPPTPLIPMVSPNTSEFLDFLQNRGAGGPSLDTNGMFQDLVPVPLIAFPPATESNSQPIEENGTAIVSEDGQNGGISSIGQQRFQDQTSAFDVPLPSDLPVPNSEALTTDSSTTLQRIIENGDLVQTSVNPIEEETEPVVEGQQQIEPVTDDYQVPVAEDSQQEAQLDDLSRLFQWQVVPQPQQNVIITPAPEEESFKHEQDMEEVGYSDFPILSASFQGPFVVPMQEQQILSDSLPNKTTGLDALEDVEVPSQEHLQNKASAKVDCDYLDGLDDCAQGILTEHSPQQLLLLSRTPTPEPQDEDVDAIQLEDHLYQQPTIEPIAFTRTLPPLQELDILNHLQSPEFERDDMFIPPPDEETTRDILLDQQTRFQFSLPEPEMEPPLSEFDPRLLQQQKQLFQEQAPQQLDDSLREPEAEIAFLKEMEPMEDENIDDRNFMASRTLYTPAPEAEMIDPKINEDKLEIIPAPEFESLRSIDKFADIDTLIPDPESEFSSLNSMDHELDHQTMQIQFVPDSVIPSPEEDFPILGSSLMLVPTPEVEHTQDHDRNVLDQDLDIERDFDNIIPAPEFEFQEYPDLILGKPFNTWFNLVPEPEPESEFTNLPQLYEPSQISEYVLSKEQDNINSLNPEATSFLPGTREPFTEQQFQQQLPYINVFSNYLSAQNYFPQQYTTGFLGFGPPVLDSKLEPEPEEEEESAVQFPQELYDNQNGDRSFSVVDDRFDDRISGRDIGGGDANVGKQFFNETEQQRISAPYVEPDVEPETDQLVELISNLPIEVLQVQTASGIDFDLQASVNGAPEPVSQQKSSPPESPNDDDGDGGGGLGYYTIWVPFLSAAVAIIIVLVIILLVIKGRTAAAAAAPVAGAPVGETAGAGRQAVLLARAEQYGYNPPV